MAAYLNALREEGTKEDLIHFLELEYEEKLKYKKAYEDCQTAYDKLADERAIMKSVAKICLGFAWVFLCYLLMLVAANYLGAIK